MLLETLTEMKLVIHLKGDKIPLKYKSDKGSQQFSYSKHLLLISLKEKEIAECKHFNYSQEILIYDT